MPMFVPACSVNSFPSRWQAWLSLSWAALFTWDLFSCGLIRASLFFSLSLPLTKICNYFLSFSPTLSFSASLPFHFHFIFFLTFPPFTSPISPSHILGMQIRICKCYGKHRSRCVTARTESAWTHRHALHASQIGIQHGPERSPHTCPIA